MSAVPRFVVICDLGSRFCFLWAGGDLGEAEACASLLRHGGTSAVFELTEPGRVVAVDALLSDRAVAGSSDPADDLMMASRRAVIEEAIQAAEVGS